MGERRAPLARATPGQHPTLVLHPTTLRHSTSARQHPHKLTSCRDVKSGLLLTRGMVLGPLVAESTSNRAAPVLDRTCPHRHLLPGTAALALMMGLKSTGGWWEGEGMHAYMHGRRVGEAAAAVAAWQHVSCHRRQPHRVEIARVHSISHRLVQCQACLPAPAEGRPLSRPTPVPQRPAHRSGTERSPRMRRRPARAERRSGPA